MFQRNIFCRSSFIFILCNFLATQLQSATAQVSNRWIGDEYFCEMYPNAQKCKTQPIKPVYCKICPDCEGCRDTGTGTIKPCFYTPEDPFCCEFVPRSPLCEARCSANSRTPLCQKLCARDRSLPWCGGPGQDMCNIYPHSMVCQQKCLNNPDLPMCKKQCLMLKDARLPWCDVGNICLINPNLPKCRQCLMNPYPEMCQKECSKYPSLPWCNIPICSPTADDPYCCETLPQSKDCHEKCSSYHFHLATCRNACKKNPSNPQLSWCNIIDDTCHFNPNAPICVCDSNPNLEMCSKQCSKDPSYDFCQEMCEKNPTLEWCRPDKLCQRRPDLPHCLDDPCQLRPDLPHCQCLRNPNLEMCSKQCSKDSSVDWCQKLCKRNPALVWCTTPPPPPMSNQTYCISFPNLPPPPCDGKVINICSINPVNRFDVCGGNVDLKELMTTLMCLMTPVLPHCATPQMRENLLKIMQFIQQYYPGIGEKLNQGGHLDDEMAQLYNTQNTAECRDKQGNKRMPGESWKENCNTCWCGNGMPLCTRMRCPGETGEELSIQDIASDIGENGEDYFSPEFIQGIPEFIQGIDSAIGTVGKARVEMQEWLKLLDGFKG